MCCDGRVSRGWTIESTNMDKIFKHEGCLFGFAGTTCHMEIFKRILKGDPYNGEDLDVTCIVLYPNQKVEEWNWKAGYGFVKERRPNPFSIGSGSAFALAALDAGVSAREAVAIAAKRDLGTGGRIRTKKL